MSSSSPSSSSAAAAVAERYRKRDLQGNRDGPSNAAQEGAEEEAANIDLGPAALPVEHEHEHGFEDDAEDGRSSIGSLHDNLLRESHTIEDFARIISEWRSERGTSSASPRKRRSGAGQGGSTLGRSSSGQHLDVMGAAEGATGSSSSWSLRRKGSASTLGSVASSDGGDQRSNRRLSVDEYISEGEETGARAGAAGNRNSVGSYGEAAPNHSSSYSPASSSPLALLARGVGQRASSSGSAAAASGIEPGSSGASTAAASTAVHDGAKVRCTCCCGRGTRRCRRARRATREWAEMEGDLRLAAEIGQALLRRSDALQSALSQSQSEHSSRIDALMKKLTSSIRETSRLEKRLEQADLNLEAADASNRALVRELDDCRRELGRRKQTEAKCAALQDRLDRSRLDLDDARQELVVEQKRADRAESRVKNIEKRNEELGASLRLAKIDGAQRGAAEETDEARAKRRAEMMKIARERVASSMTTTSTDAKGAGGESEALLDDMLAENATMERNNEQLKQLLDGCNDEIARLREELTQRDETVTLRERSTDEGDEGTRRFGSEGMREHGDVEERKEESEPVVGASLSEEIIEATPVKSKVRSYRRPNLPSSVVSSAGSVSGAEVDADADVDIDGASSVTTSATTATTSTTPTTTTASTRPPQSSSSLGGPDDNNQKSALLAAPTSSSISKRELRTAQLVNLTDHVQRLFTRLAQADVDTLAKRLQRQHLTGDVGHLARTTVNGILRDADGLRDHFKRLIDAESRHRDADAASLGSSSKGSSSMDRESESLVARKEFFALVKVFKDLFFEMARLRNAVNEVHLNPGQASRILGEQLGLNGGQEDKGVMGAWLGRLFSGPTTGNATAAGSTAQAASQSSASSTTATAAAAQAPRNVRRQPSRNPSGSQLAAPRASAAVVSSTVAVEIKGTTHASAESGGATALDDAHSESSSSTPSLPTASGFTTSGFLQAGPRPEVKRAHPHSLARTQSRNLSGLFVGSIPGQNITTPDASVPASSSSATSRGLPPAGYDHTKYRLSRIVDDDEISIRDGFVPERTLRPRGLSDSSIRSTFLDGDPHSKTSPTKSKSKGLSGSAASRGEGQGPSPISRIITPSTLALQVNSTAAPSLATLPSSSTSSSRQQAQAATSASSSMFPKALGFLSAAASVPSTNFGLPSLRSTSYGSSTSSTSGTAAGTSTNTSTEASAPITPRPSLGLSSPHLDGLPRGGRMAF